MRKQAVEEKTNTLAKRDGVYSECRQKQHTCTNVCEQAKSDAVAKSEEMLNQQIAQAAKVSSSLRNT